MKKFFQVKKRPYKHSLKCPVSLLYSIPSDSPPTDRADDIVTSP